MNDAQIHWFSIINSLMIVIFLTGIVAMIMLRTLHRDITHYNRDHTEELDVEETGWKLVHGDVFRPPARGELLSVLTGTGIQFLGTGIFTLIVAVMGLLSPSNHGSVITAILVLFVLMGSLAGFVSTRLHNSLGLANWRRNTFSTALAFPGISFGVFFFLDLVVWAEKSSAAVPFFEMLALLVMWLGISVPLVYLGSYFANRLPPLDPVVKVNLIPRVVPSRAWYMRPVFSILIGGVLPFGAVFIEVFFVMSSVWLHRQYYVFGFLLVVFFILILTCSEISIVMCYFQLCGEDYHWWWRSFLTSGSSAFYLFLYSVLYFSTKLDITKFVSGLLFFGYMALVTAVFFVLTGSIGFLSTYVFVRRIYGAIKIE
jgi:transmembrane 9 superfamily protein 2/4